MTRKELKQLIRETVEEAKRDTLQDLLAQRKAIDAKINAFMAKSITPGTLVHVKKNRPGAEDDELFTHHVDAHYNDLDPIAFKVLKVNGTKLTIKAAESDTINGNLKTVVDIRYTYPAKGPTS